MWELHHEEGWVLKNCCFRTVVLEKTLESPLDSKDIKPVNPKQNQLWIFIGKTDDEAEPSIFWSPDAKNWLTGKDSHVGSEWGQEEKGTIENEMVGWHHRHNGHGFEQTSKDSEGEGSLVYCSPWGRKESDMTEWLKTTNHTIQHSCIHTKLLQSCPALCNPMDYNPPSSSVHGILQAIILEWVAIPFSRDLPNPEIRPRCPALQAYSLHSGPPGKSLLLSLSLCTYIQKN